MKFKGILAAARSKDEVVAAYVAAATGSSRTYFKSQSSDVYAAAGSVKFDPVGQSELTDCTAELSTASVKFASQSATVTTNLSVCLDGCQQFILSDLPNLARCPSCSASLADVDEERLYDLFGSESADLPERDPLFVGTEEQARSFVAALRSGNHQSISGCSELRYDPFSGMESKSSNSSTSEFQGVFHQFRCAADCSNPVTVSASADVVFCAHCSAPLHEKSTMKIGRIQTQVVAHGASLSAVASAFRQLISGGGTGVYNDASSAAFVSASAVKFNVLTGDPITSSRFDSISCSGASNAAKVEMHVQRCSNGCGFCACSSDDALFCAECGSVLTEPDESDLTNAADAGVEPASDDSSLDDLDSDLNELDDSDDFDSESGDDDFGDEDDLDLDDSDDSDDSLSEDDYDMDAISGCAESDDDSDDDESDDLDEDEDFDSESEDDGLDLDLDDDDSSDDSDKDDSDDLDSESGDDEDADDLDDGDYPDDDDPAVDMDDDSDLESDSDDPDTMLDDDEADDIDFDGDGASESGNSVISSVSAVEALESIDQADAKSVSMVYDGKDAWYMFHNKSPIASLSFTDLSNTIKDEARAKSMFYGPSLSNVVARAVSESGIKGAIAAFGFRPVEFNVSVSNVVRKRAEKAADERVNKINSEIESLSAERTERLRAAVDTAMRGMVSGFWADRNPVADALVQRIAATGVSMSSARDMVNATFAQHGAEMCDVVFSRSADLLAKPLDVQNELAAAITERQSVSVSSAFEDSLTSIGNAGKRAAPAQDPVLSSVSADAASDFDARLERLL